MKNNKLLILILVFVAIAIMSVIFLANVGEMGSVYSENSTFAETNERLFGMFNLILFLFLPLGIVLSIVIIFIMVKWAFSQVGGNY